MNPPQPYNRSWRSRSYLLAILAIILFPAGIITAQPIPLIAAASLLALALWFLLLDRLDLIADLLRRK